MFRFQSPQHRRTLEATRIAAVFCTLAVSSAAGAQSLSAPDQVAQEASSQSAPGNSAQPEVSATRGLFLALIAQGVGAEIGSALWKGLRGSITKWFSHGSDKSDSLAQGVAGPAATTRDSAPLQAGIAYEVHLVGRDGAARPVDPVRHVFRTNDEFVVYYRPTLPGRVRVLNIDPRGNESRIDAAEVAAGQLATLGPYRFVENKGKETLKLTLEPCRSPTLAAATRQIVRIEAQSAPKPSMRVIDCRDLTAGAGSASTRNVRTTVDGATTFALDPVSSEEARSGLFAPREVTIVFQHV